MDGRKRQPEEVALPFGKRCRSVLPLKRNSNWGCSAEHLRTLPIEDAGADEDVGEAIAALLSIAREASTPPREAARRAETDCQGATETEVAALKIAQWEDTSRSSIDIGIKAEPAAEGLPSTSSGSDESTSTAISLALGNVSSCRTSFDSTTGPSGLLQHKLPRQDSLQLFSKEALEASVAGARQQPEAAPRLAAPAQPTLTITTKPGAALDAAAMHTNFWNASFWTPRFRTAAGPAAKAGYNVISSGVPHSPASKLPSLQASGGLPDATSCQAWPRQQKVLQKAQLGGSEQAEGPAAAPVSATFSNGRLIIITPSQHPAAEPALKLPSRSVVVQPRPAPSVEQQHWPPAPPPQKAAGESSGDEASDKVWQTNWGLDLFSALNPSVITTGVTVAAKEGN